MCSPRLCFVFFVYLTVAYANEDEQPYLEVQPKSVTKPVDSSLALTCRPHVNDPGLVTQLEWRDPKGKRIESSRSLPVYVQSLTGEPGIVLIFSKLTDNQGGNYTCQANFASEILRTVIPVNTFVEINFVDAPTSQFPIVGSDFGVKCKVHGNPAPMIDWNKDGESISNNNKYIIQPHQLLIKNVTEADDGVYKCTAVVLMTGQIKNREIKVEVHVPPTIEPMTSLSVVEGEKASIKCKGHGKPPPTYTWIKENTRQDLAITDRFDVRKQTGELIINRVEFNDDSLYSCIAKNAAGEANTTVKINVRVKPEIYELYNVTVPIRKDAKLICKVKGRPPPKVTFRKLSSQDRFVLGQQSTDKRIVLEQTEDEAKGESMGILSIQGIIRPDDGLFECIAENVAGKAYKNGHITVEFPPTFERTRDLPPVWSWEGRPGNLTCIPEAIPNATIVWKYNDIEIQNSSRFRIQGYGPQSSLIVQPQNDPRFYTYYECIAKNKLGENRTRIMLKQGVKPGTIPQTKAESITATTIKFSIVPPNNFDGLPIKSYTVQYKPEREYSWDYARNHTWASGAPYILENLVPEATYHFRFAARNDVGLGGYANSESITMPRRSEPAEPKILIDGHYLDKPEEDVKEEIIHQSPYPDQYEIKWNVPNNNGDPIQHYLIRFCAIVKVNGRWSDKECSEEIQQSREYTNYLMTGLYPDTVYKVELRAHNSIGDSSPAQIKVKTSRGVDPVVPVETPAMSSALIIGIVVAAVLLVLVVVDVTCFCVNRTGIIALICSSKSKKHDEEDPKLGREEREPLKNIEKDTSVEFDGKQVYTKSGQIIGKNSAV